MSENSDQDGIFKNRLSSDSSDCLQCGTAVEEGGYYCKECEDAFRKADAECRERAKYVRRRVPWRAYWLG